MGKNNPQWSKSHEKYNRDNIKKEPRKKDLQKYVNIGPVSEGYIKDNFVFRKIDILN